LGEIVKHRISLIDENHGLYGNAIGLQYVFEGGLDAQVLGRSVRELIRQFPALSGRYAAKSGQVLPSPEKLTLTVQKHTGSIGDTPHRPQFISEPNRRDVLRGRASLSTFTLTKFECGGVIFGMAISHMLTDAAGFHSLMKHL